MVPPLIKHTGLRELMDELKVSVEGSLTWHDLIPIHEL